MNDGFRQRLVGAVVLICLALIIWPILFSDSRAPSMDRRSQIPPMPAYEKYSIPAPQKPANVEPVSTDITEDSVVENGAGSRSATAVQKDIGLDKRGLPVAWAIKVGSFSKEKNASDLKLKLQDKGYKAYVKTVRLDGKTVWRVYVGPKQDKQELDKARQAIEKAYKLKADIVRYVP